MGADTGHRGFTVRLVDWAEAVDGLRAVRRAVFIDEQAIPEDMEWDAFDATCRHAIAEDPSGKAVGCGRLLPDGHIGRLAVLRDWRGQGVGAALLVNLMDLARSRGHARAILEAQTRAMPFYVRHGFAAAGDEYVEAGIPHLTMTRTL
jgi:predicted GNAT family N-acyltransferase